MSTMKPETTAQPSPKNKDDWRKCDYCGRYIAIHDFETDSAIRHLISEDTSYSSEDWEVCCKECKPKFYQPSQGLKQELHNQWVYHISKCNDCKGYPKLCVRGKQLHQSLWPSLWPQDWKNGEPTR